MLQPMLNGLTLMSAINGQPMHAFFTREGHYGHFYTLDGGKISSDHSPGLVATNGVGGLVSRDSSRNNFIEKFGSSTLQMAATATITVSTLSMLYISEVSSFATKALEL